MTLLARLLLLAAAVAAAHELFAQTAAGRGALLYETHCIECHTAQMHWRERRQARDWATLRAQVLRWQAQAQLGWTGAEVDDVTRYLNRAIYHFAPPQEQASRAAAAAHP